MDINSVVEIVRNRAMQDEDFRRMLLENAGEAVFKATGEVIPKNVKITVHENSRENMCFVIPAKACDKSAELSDAEMDQVAGGGKDTVYTLEKQYGHYDSSGGVVIDRVETYNSYTKV